MSNSESFVSIAFCFTWFHNKRASDQLSIRCRPQWSIVMGSTQLILIQIWLMTIENCVSYGTGLAKTFLISKQIEKVFGSKIYELFSAAFKLLKFHLQASKMFSTPNKLSLPCKHKQNFFLQNLHYCNYFRVISRFVTLFLTLPPPTMKIKLCENGLK